MAKGSLTRQRIIDRAIPVFNTRGYAGTSMADLLAATGLEKGGIYNHFASKEALALAAFDDAVAQVGRRFLEAMAPHQHAIDRLMALAGVFEDYLADPPVPGGCPVVNTAVEADDAYPLLREHAQAAMTSWQRLIGRTIKDGVAAGQLRPDADPYEVASVMTSLLEGALVLSRLYGDPAYLQRAARHLTGYLAGLVAEREVEA